MKLNYVHHKEMHTLSHFNTNPDLTIHAYHEKNLPSFDDTQNNTSESVFCSLNYFLNGISFCVNTAYLSLSNSNFLDFSTSFGFVWGIFNAAVHHFFVKSFSFQYEKLLKEYQELMSSNDKALSDEQIKKLISDVFQLQLKKINSKKRRAYTIRTLAFFIESCVVGCGCAISLLATLNPIFLLNPMGSFILIGVLLALYTCFMIYHIVQTHRLEQNDVVCHSSENAPPENTKTDQSSCIDPLCTSKWLTIRSILNTENFSLRHAQDLWMVFHPHLNSSTHNARAFFSLNFVMHFTLSLDTCLLIQPTLCFGIMGCAFGLLLGAVISWLSDHCLKNSERPHTIKKCLEMCINKIPLYAVCDEFITVQKLMQEKYISVQENPEQAERSISRQQWKNTALRLCTGLATLIECAVTVQSVVPYFCASTFIFAQIINPLLIGITASMGLIFLGLIIYSHIEKIHAQKAAHGIRSCGLFSKLPCVRPSNPVASYASVVPSAFPDCA